MENQKRNNRAGDSYPIGKQSCRSKPGPCNIRCDDGGVEFARNTITEISTIRIRGKNRIIGFCVKGCGNATRPVISGGTAWLNPRRSSDRPTITPCNNWEASFNHRRVSLPGNFTASGGMDMGWIPICERTRRIPQKSVWRLFWRLNGN